MTALENFDLLISGKVPRWIPFTLDIGATDGLSSAVRSRFTEETGWSDAAEYFDYDFRIASISRRFGGEDPRSFLSDAPPGTEFDEWGVGLGPEKVLPPLENAREVAQIEEYPPPVTCSEGVTEAVREFHGRGYPVVGYAGSVSEWSERLRGTELLAADVVDRPAIAEAIVEKVAGFTRALAEDSAAAGIDVLAFSDGTRFSPSLWRSLIKPAWESVLQAVSRRFPKVVFFLHSSGEIGEIVSDLVELGFHILHPAEPECMDAATVKRQWGNKIIVCATLEARATLCSSSAEDVRITTSRVMDLLGGDRRCIVCPSARIGPDTPWENVLAFTCAARNHRFGKRGSLRKA
jgi:uroporphyrinogen-III decarboxylase